MADTFDVGFFFLCIGLVIWVFSLVSVYGEKIIWFLLTYGQIFGIAMTVLGLILILNWINDGGNAL